MASDLVDRIAGLRGSLAFKAPARVATTANIVLSGEQTIDGVAVLEVGANNRRDRVLVKNQTNPIENGIYDVSTGSWLRSRDFDGNDDAVTGTRIYVPGGSTQAGEYYLTSADPVIIDASAITWSASGTGAGNVFGPTNATDNAYARFDLTTGKVLQNSLATEDDSGNVAGMVTLTLPNTGLHLLDTNASHDLIIKPGSNITADRTLTVTTGDTNITLNLTDPGADRLLFWDDSADTWRDLTLGTNLSITTTTINAAGLPAASTAEMEAASSNVVGVTPGVQHRHPGHPKAWVQYNTTVFASNQDFGVSGLTDNAAGDVTVTFDTVFTVATYAISGSGQRAADEGMFLAVKRASAPSTTSARVVTANNAGNAEDSVYSSALFSGDQ